jgi:hypothetical protein
MVCTQRYQTALADLDSPRRLVYLPNQLKEVAMERVMGIGGVFLKAHDPKALAAWYRDHLGVPVDPGQTYGAVTSSGPGEMTVWSTFPADTQYFGPGPATFMVNYRVKKR